MKHLLIIFAHLSCLSLLAQSNQLSNSQTYRNNIGRSDMFHSFVRTIPPMQEKDIGSSFILNEFTNAEVFLKTIADTLFVDLANYDSKTKTLIFQDNGAYKAIPRNILREFKLANRYFINSSELADYPDPIPVFLEQVHNEKNVSLFIDYEVNVVAPNYNVALNVGSKSAKVSTEETFHLRMNDQWFLNFTFKKKYIKDNFDERSNDILAFAKKEKLQDSIDDIKKLADFLVENN